MSRFAVATSQNKQGASGIFFLLVESLLRQLLRGFGSPAASRAPRLREGARRDDRRVQKFGAASLAYEDTMPLALFAHIDRSKQIRVIVAHASGSFSNRPNAS